MYICAYLPYYKRTLTNNKMCARPHLIKGNKQFKIKITKNRENGTRKINNARFMMI